ELTSGSTWLAAGNVVQWTSSRTASRLHQYSIRLYRDLEAGREFGLVPLGMRALLNSLRLEKSYRLGGDICGEETAIEAGLEPFVRFDKGEFVGREALLRKNERGIAKRFVTLIVDAGDADAYGDEAVWSGDQVVGRVTSGGWGHRVEKSIALGFVAVEVALPGTILEVEILDERRTANVVPPSVYDPENKKLKG
ncbi:MAG: aminomethyltransferase family protein, partial [Deltaproteobacteria bacterium]|nr:aminomethyltransferase family protein [Deltaproteobacteria bacterium]